MNTKYTLKAIWHFIWEDDSLLSWVVNIILAFVLIKFIIFPVLGFILGSKFPVVAVVSDSMEHDSNFDTWWTSNAVCGAWTCPQSQYYLSKFNITKEQFLTFKFKNGFNKGDVMVLTSPKHLNLGDTVVFFAKDGRPIIHRVVGLNPLQTKGDHNSGQIENNILNEKDISANVLVGKASVRVLFLGYAKIAFAWILSLFGLQVA